MEFLSNGAEHRRHTARLFSCDRRYFVPSSTTSDRRAANDGCQALGSAELNNLQTYAARLP
jgi:hypothetical protein